MKEELERVGQEDWASCVGHAKNFEEKILQKKLSRTTF
jgi:hypothetical protein